jgi:methylated-DNA-[protein]-cysteine S-methyltransferase
MRTWTEWNDGTGLTLRIAAENGAICAVEFAGPCMEDSSVPALSSAQRVVRKERAPDRRDDGDKLLMTTCRQLTDYFGGSRRNFELPLAMTGTDFQLRVWRLLQEIPYGETRSYRDLAAALGRTGAVRAVGAANGANPLAIVIPCHRVIGSNGKLVGYGGGLRLKKRLLDWERQNAGDKPSLNFLHWVSIG